MEFIHVKSSNRYQTFLKATPCVIALGFFDGVHLGHQQVIKEAKKQAEQRELPLKIMSFFPHPKEVIANEKNNFPYLMPIADKQKIFKNLGADCFYVIQFDAEFAALSPKQFVQNYLLDFGAKQVVAGFDFTYGHRGEGNMDRIISDSDGKIDMTKVRKQEYAGEKISSTLIRELILTGELEKVPKYLGDFYQIEGEIYIHDQEAELKIHPYYMLPPSGLYEVSVTNQQVTTRLRGLVANGKLNLLFFHRQNIPFKQGETIRLSWQKRLPKENKTEVDGIHSFTLVNL